MPRKIPLTEKREWLNLYEQGNSEASIARDAHRDVKTIKRGIEEARNERNASIVKAELLKNAVGRHHDQLLDVIRNIMDALAPPIPDLELRREPDGSLAPIRLSGATVSYDSMKGLVLVLHDENTIQWELLREHLRRDRLWNTLNQWKKSVVAHIQARTALHLKAEMLLEESTGLTELQHIDNAPEAGYFYPGAVGLLYQVVLKAALQILDSVNLEEQIAAESGPYVSHGETGSPLAYCPGRVEECKQNVLAAYKKLQESPEVEKLAATYREAREATTKTKRAVEEIYLLRLVPGQCRICRRLGV